MTIKIYNSQTSKKEEFKPQTRGKVNMYTCGVTVYDACHIGHARSLYIFEVIRRYLRFRGFDIKLVRNITDVDDKIINKAREWAKKEGISLKEAFDKVRIFYIADYYNDLKALGLPKADEEPLATENIKEIVEYISKLLEKGFAYEQNGNVYFSVRKLDNYGSLSGNSLDEVQEAVRIEADAHKKDPVDFALWKKAKKEEPSWDSPWGQGRPGWHIECSVMSQKYLKAETLDIHGGGRDLIFPHHENEKAQAEALTGKKFANYWIHHGLLTINSRKMAKSLGNFVSIKDFIKKYRDADLLKLFFLSAHYSNPIDFNEEKIEEVKKQKKNFYDFFDRLDLKEQTKEAANSTKDIEKVDEICIKFQQAMDDDFNMPKGLAVLFELVDLGSKFASSDKESALKYIDKKLLIFFDIFGLKRKKNKGIRKEIRSMAKERDQARKNREFKKADELRSKIESQVPYIIADTANAFTFIAKQLPDED